MSTAPCPCGEPLGGRYWHHGQLVCWPCTRLRPTEPPPPRDSEWVRFRKRIIAALEHDGASSYVSADRVAGRCPICEEPLGVRFKGQTPVAEFVCHAGCPEEEVVRRVGRSGECR
jgi:hypothetical protein